MATSEKAKATKVTMAVKETQAPKSQAAPQTPKISDLREVPETAKPETEGLVSAVSVVSAGTAEVAAAEQKNDSIAASRARFARLIRENMLEAQAHDGGIGTLGEKRMHAVIKNYLADRRFQEIRMDAVEGSHATRFVADVFDGERIFEVQKVKQY